MQNITNTNTTAMQVTKQLFSFLSNETNEGWALEELLNPETLGLADLLGDAVGSAQNLSLPGVEEPSMEETLPLLKEVLMRTFIPFTSVRGFGSCITASKEALELQAAACLFTATGQAGSLIALKELVESWEFINEDLVRDREDVLDTLYANPHKEGRCYYGEEDLYLEGQQVLIRWERLQELTVEHLPLPKPQTAPTKESAMTTNQPTQTQPQPKETEMTNVQNTQNIQPLPLPKEAIMPNTQALYAVQVNNGALELIESDKTPHELLGEYLKNPEVTLVRVCDPTGYPIVEGRKEVLQDPTQTVAPIPEAVQEEAPASNVVQQEVAMPISTFSRKGALTGETLDLIREDIRGMYVEMNSQRVFPRWDHLPGLSTVSEKLKSVGHGFNRVRVIRKPSGAANNLPKSFEIRGLDKTKPIAVLNLGMEASFSFDGASLAPLGVYVKEEAGNIVMDSYSVGGTKGTFLVVFYSQEGEPEFVRGEAINVQDYPGRVIRVEESAPLFQLVTREEEPVVTSVPETSAQPHEDVVEALVIDNNTHLFTMIPLKRVGNQFVGPNDPRPFNTKGDCLKANYGKRFEEIEQLKTS